MLTPPERIHQNATLPLYVPSHITTHPRGASSREAARFLYALVDCVQSIQILLATSAFLYTVFTYAIPRIYIRLIYSQITLPNAVIKSA